MNLTTLWSSVITCYFDKLIWMESLLWKGRRFTCKSILHFNTYFVNALLPITLVSFYFNFEEDDIYSFLFDLKDLRLFSPFSSCIQRHEIHASGRANGTSQAISKISNRQFERKSFFSPVTCPQNTCSHPDNLNNVLPPVHCIVRNRLNKYMLNKEVTKRVFFLEDSLEFLLLLSIPQSRHWS